MSSAEQSSSRKVVLPASYMYLMRSFMASYCSSPLFCASSIRFCVSSMAAAVSSIWVARLSISLPRLFSSSLRPATSFSRAPFCFSSSSVEGSAYTRVPVHPIAATHPATTPARSMRFNLVLIIYTFPFSRRDEQPGKYISVPGRLSIILQIALLSNFCYDK